jgi:predicted alpha/beta superfamily hydrolase
MSNATDSRPSSVPIANSELLEYDSKCVGQHYQIKVRLPEAYAESTEAYPVLYMPDGDHWFAMATDIVEYLIYGQHMPDMIIVSSAYGSKKPPKLGGTNMRFRDLWPFTDPDSELPAGADNFFCFFEQELIPFIEATYRVDATERVFAGGSAGAIFALYTLFRHPLLFSRYITIDGMDNRLLPLEEAFAAQEHTLAIKLFMGSGSFDMSGLAATMQKRSYSGLQLEHVHLNDLGHFATPAEGLTKGLISVFGM